MKTLLRIIVLMLALVPASLSSVASPAEDAIAASEARLKKIHAALAAFEKARHQWPDHLSDLVPDFLPSVDDLRDPADPGTGSLGSDQAFEDPKLRVSYSYERNAEVSGGLACPLGPFPKSDIEKASWGSWRLVNGHQEYFWGDQVPVVRCYLHRPPAEERADGHDLVLNLTPSGRIYRSRFEWKHHPDSIDFMLKTLLRDFSQGPKHVDRHWFLWRVNEYLSDCDDQLGEARFAPTLSPLANLLMDHRDALENKRTACQLAALFELKLGHTDRCLAALDAAAGYPGAEWHPIVDGQRRAQAYHAAKNFTKEIETYRWLLQQRPNVGSYQRGLAAALDASGDAAGANEVRAQADPGAGLVGKSAPEFSVPLLQGGPLTLKEALREKKAIVLNFWFLGCGPCLEEMPHLQRLQEKFPDTLRVVAVSTSDTAEKVAKFDTEKHTGLTFALAAAKGGRPNSIVDSYHVQVCPTNYVIDNNGKILWRGTGFGAEDLRALEAALEQAGLR